MSKPIITVVGSFAVGMTLRTSHMPVFGETLLGSDFDMGPGGKGSNQAVGTARLGANSYFAGIIGQDKLGEIATDLYAREGVDTTYLIKTARLATVVDTTGAGDAFNSGLAVALAAGQPLAAAVRYAACAGAIACTKLGVIPSLGAKAQVDQFYAAHTA